MPQDQSAARMMNTVQNSLTQDSQQFINPVPPTQPAQPNQIDPNQQQQNSTVTTAINQAVPEISDQQKLALFETVVQEVENTQLGDQSQQITSASKERMEIGQQMAPQELPGGLQYVEAEPLPEIPPEVESFLQQAEEQPEKFPEEIVRAAQQFEQESIASGLPQSVKVLPITKAQAEKGRTKNTSFSLRWLVEFSNKISRLFAGKSIYRED